MAVSATDQNEEFGRLLKFRDTFGRWREWAMPMELLKGSCEELRGELLRSGVEIEQSRRAMLADYLQSQTPKNRITAALRGGWTASGNSFVLRDRVIGDENIYFQSEMTNISGGPSVGGTYAEWQKLAALSAGNPVLILSLCVSLAGPLLALVNRESGGVHWVGDSSIGKSTGLELGVSVWGGDDFRRTWQATANGLESVAALLSGTCLCIDELNQADPKDVGAIIYTLGNGTGKARANRSGGARNVAKWQLSIISTGERTLEAVMAEAGKQAKAGQLVRLVNIAAARKHGIFDELHHFEDGRQFADHLKTETKRHYGHAGIKFIEFLLARKKEGEDFGKMLAVLETYFEHSDSQAGRVAGRFAVYAMAGELAIDAGILQLQEGDAARACIDVYTRWLEMRGDGITEHKQILQNIIDFVNRYGDIQFTDKTGDDPPKIKRSGWFTDRCGERVYLFTPTGLRDAGGNYDFNRVLDAIDMAGWIVERDCGKRSKTTAIHGRDKAKLYWVLPRDG